jgi:hypothetical protein
VNSSARVVSLVPSATETLLAWGADVVACTRFCEQPALVHVGGTKDPDVDAIAALRPDVVVVDREENRREDAERTRGCGHERARDARPLARRRGAAAARARGRVGRTAVSIDARRARSRSGARRSCRSGAAVDDDQRDTYGSTLLGHLGVRNVYADADSAYPVVVLDDVAARSPDLVLLPSEPYSFRARHVDEIAARSRGARSPRRRAGPVLVGEQHPSRASAAQGSPACGTSTSVTSTCPCARLPAPSG